MRFRVAVFAAVIASFIGATANATVILSLVIDPPTEADAFVAPQGGFLPTSSKSGPGTYHLFALDTTVGSFGISSYDIRLANTVTNLHRSPTTAWNDADENGPYNAGFSLLRTASNNGGIFQASQPLRSTTPVLITGFGQEASDFQEKIGLPGVTFALTTSGAWGHYATISPLGDKHWVFVGEGDYAVGTPPVISQTSITYYSNQQFSNALADTCVLNVDCFFETFGVNDLDLGLVPRGTPISATLGWFGIPNEPLTWMLESFTGPGGDVSGAQVDLNSGEFTWDSAGAALGDYSAVIRVFEAGFPSDIGTLTFTLTVPEPASFVSCFLALPFFALRIRRRNGIG
jgi:hypothetical protein